MKAIFVVLIVALIGGFGIHEIYRTIVPHIAVDDESESPDDLQSCTH